MSYVSEIHFFSATLSLADIQQILQDYEHSSGRVVALGESNGINALALADDQRPDKDIRLRLIEPGQDAQTIEHFDLILVALIQVQGELRKVALHRQRA